MDLTETIAAKSDQLNAEDLIGGDVTVTVEKVSRGNPEQPVDVHLVEFPGRAYRPSKSMRRILVALWGKDSSAYIGRRLTLYRDASVKFGGEEVGGIKISHASGIDKPMKVALTVTRGKRAQHRVDPLPDAPPAITPEMVAACTDTNELKAMWMPADGATRNLIEARAAELAGANPETGEVVES